jgi:syntaxin 1B/2/3
LRQKRERQLHAAQQAVLDSTNSATDQQTRRNLDNVESEITAALRQTRDMVADLKHKLRSNPDGSAAVHTQVGLLGRNLQEEVEQMRKSQMVFDRTLREQVRRRYEIANPDATAEEIDSGVEGVISGQAQAFQVLITDYRFNCLYMYV